jgi:hypothetical protein
MQKNFEKNIFLPCLSHPKFYYITHLCGKGLSRKFDFFQFFIIKTCVFFLKIDFTLKICSFEVHCVDVPQKLRDW